LQPGNRNAATLPISSVLPTRFSGTSRKRFGKPEEIGTVAAFLLSPVASFLAGAMLPVDGAQSC
jgi:NAD(P)-dependent dehydrogenase (short-subunit alcohol dehydrogenase family)